MAFIRTATSRERSSPTARRRRAKKPGPAGRPRLPRATTDPASRRAACVGSLSSRRRGILAPGARPGGRAAMLDCRAMEVLVRPARDRSDYDACVRLQREVWGLSDLEITSVIQLIATVHAGGLLLVADSPEDGVLGFSYAFAALRGGEGHLHSDMLAVSPAARGLGVGLRLKWAQREEALRRGLRLVTWTFDPMRAGNARLNLHHLGAIAARAPPGLLRHHELRPAPRPRHRPAAGPLGARPPARRAARGRRAGRPDGPRGRARAHRGRVAQRLARPVASAPRPRGPGAPPGDPRRLGRGVRRRRGAGAGVAAGRALRRSSPRSPAATRPRASSRPARRARGPPTSSGRTSLRRLTGRPYSSPVAAGSDGSDDHSLHEPA